MAGPLFIAAFTREGAMRPGYDPMREPVSALALGERGWTQRANFIGTGTLMLAYSAGLRRALPGSRWGPRLVAAFAVGLVGAGVFVTDPVPATTPGELSPAAGSTHGDLHNIFSLVVFGALVGACGALGRRFAKSGHPGWAAYSALSGLLVVMGIRLFGRGFDGAKGFVDVGGLIQRVTIAIGWGWLAVVAVHLLHSAPRRRASY